MCRVFSCVVGRGCLQWPVCSLGKTLLAFSLLHFIFQGQICLLLQVFLDFLLWHSSSVQFSRSVVSDSLRPHGLQHTRPPCPSPTPGVYSNTCPIKSVMPFNHLILCSPLLLLPSVFPRIRVFSNESDLRIRWPIISTGASASASVRPMDIQD